MKSKLVVVGLALSAMAAILATRSRTGPDPVAAPSAVAPSPRPTASARPTLESHPQLASYRVTEEERAGDVLPYRGANYRASVSPEGLRFEAGEHRIAIRASRIEQGATVHELSASPPARESWAKASVDRGQGVREDFVFENRRVEHLVRLEKPLGEGDLKVRVAVDTSLTGPVREVRRGDTTWKDISLEDGGLVFSTPDGTPALSYHGAVVIDAAGRRRLFDPRWENGEIALVVPADFMKDAAYPVIIDPWLELDLSGSGGGISKSGTVSETPAIALVSGGSPAVAWSDASDGDFDIYFKYWNGDAWTVLGTDNVSANSGKSTNPTIGFFTPTNTNLFHPFIAWEDDLSGTTNVYARFWTGSSWGELGGSASSSGVSLSLGIPARNPQAVGVAGLVQNNATTPNRPETFPCIVWELEGVGIRSRFFYPGDNRTVPAPSGWYGHPAGASVVFNSSAARPSIALDSANNLAVAFEMSSGTDFDIFVVQANVAGAPYVINFAGQVPTAGPATAWALVGGGNVCDDPPALPAALSIQPSLTVDANDDLWVAWQESVGAEREIYVRRSVGGGAWAQVGASSTGLGISGTTVVGAVTTSSFPSISVDPFSLPARPVVAWEDDASGNSEIFVRRLNAGQTAWNQIADEGSSTLVAPEVTGNPGGVSRTPSFSLRPKLIVAPGGTATVAWRDGASGTFDLYLRRYHDNTPSDLQQNSVSGATLTLVGAGGTTGSTTIQFSGVLIAESTAVAPLRLQVEVRPNTTAFTGQPTHESLEVATGARATVLFTGLPNTNYHWRARSMDAVGRSSPWIPFGNNADGSIDLRIDSSAPGAGVPNTVTATVTDDKDRCGLVGLDALGLLALAAFLRRRRKA